ncbi:MAG: NAD-dependent epimerase/dehydratase family protein [Solirubrobacteraceae bacterium]
MARRNAVVTGGAGFIGLHLVDLLLAEGFAVRVLDDLSTGVAEYVEAGWEGLLEGAELVFHLAGLPRIQPSFDDPLTHEKVNVVGTINCMLGCRQAGVRRVVCSSSSTCYGDPARMPTPEDESIAPLSPYALEKYAAEQNVLLLGERWGIETVSLRYFNVYGPRSYNEENVLNAYSSFVGIFSRQRARGESLTVTGDGSQERDFVFVTDVARANFAAAVMPGAHGACNVGSGQKISILELAKLFDHPYTFVEERKGEARVTWADIGRIERELEWRPVISLADGVALLEAVL